MDKTYIEGAKAAFKNKSIKDNPYRYGSYDHSRWLEGYFDYQNGDIDAVFLNQIMAC